MTPSPAQIAARERFAERARAGDFRRGPARRKRQRNPTELSQWGTPIDTDTLPGVSINWTDTRHGEVRRFDEDLHVGRESIDPGWFVFGRWAGASANVVKRIAWPTAPLRRWPKISRLVQPGWRTKAEAQSAADYLRGLVAPKGNPLGPAVPFRSLPVGAEFMFADPAGFSAHRQFTKTSARGYVEVGRTAPRYTVGAVSVKVREVVSAPVRNPRSKDPLQVGPSVNPSDMTVANTILQQLGGSRFLAMTGAKNLLGDPDSLSFTLPARMAREGINKVRITLQPDDTYGVQFMRYSLRATEPLRMVKQLQGVYADSLREAFTTYTGLQVSLGTMGRNPTGKRTGKGKPARPFYYIIESRPRGPFYIELSSEHHTLEQVKAIAQQRADKYGVQASIREFHS